MITLKYTFWKHFRTLIGFYLKNVNLGYICPFTQSDENCFFNTHSYFFQLMVWINHLFFSPFTLWWKRTFFSYVKKQKYFSRSQSSKIPSKAKKNDSTTFCDSHLKTFPVKNSKISNPPVHAQSYTRSPISMFPFSQLNTQVLWSKYYTQSPKFYFQTSISIISSAT